MNSQWHAATKEKPYKLVFGQVPWSALVSGASKHVVNEEDMNSVISASPPSASDRTTSSPRMRVIPLT